MSYVTRSRAWTGCLAVVCALAGAVACGSDDDDDSAPAGGGSAGTGGGGASGMGGGDTGGGGTGGSSGMGGGGTGGSSGTGGGGPSSFTCTGAPMLTLTEVASGADEPLLAVWPPNDDTRMFVLEQRGVIRIWQDGAFLPTPFLDIQDLVRSDDDVMMENERGLLGLAFHPDFATNGKVYIDYTAEAGDGVELGDQMTVEYTVSASDPNQADTASARVLMQLPDDEWNHNGGNLVFGKDGFLYIARGDGGGGGDQHGATGNGQNLGVLFGKILRIDVDGRDVDNAYSIPPGNMTGDGVRPEIYHYGLRNPWRFSFDPVTNYLYIGDVGQSTYEEVDVDDTGASGLNFGWRVMEGLHCYEGNDCDMSGITLPVAEYGRDLGQSVTGGYVYRGSAIPGLVGAYLYADFVSGEFWAFVYENGAAREQCRISDLISPDIVNITSFARDNSGELYVVSRDGSIYKIEPG